MGIFCVFKFDSNYRLSVIDVNLNVPNISGFKPFLVEKSALK